MFLIDMFNQKTVMPQPAHVLAGREAEMPTSTHHFVNGAPLKGPFPDDTEKVLFGMGKFWSAEKLFWNSPGVYVTAAGYACGYTKNPTHQETTTGLTGHAEVVLVVFQPNIHNFENLLKTFFEKHDPTQGMRQGNDIGTAYRSVIHVFNARQRIGAEAARTAYQMELKKAGRSAKITTEIAMADAFYYAHDDHQQYLAKNPGADSRLSGTGIACVL